jgi:alkaline phosphatase D
MRADVPSVFQATGIKICEPAAESALVWTRVTRHGALAGEDRPLPSVRVFDSASGEERPIRDNAMYSGVRVEVSFPESTDWDSIRGAAPGAAGESRILFRREGTEDWTETAWGKVDPSRDFTRTIRLTDLTPGTRYELIAEARPLGGDVASSRVEGRFRTAPAPADSSVVRFCVMTCQQYEDRDRPDGFAIYPAMLGLGPDFFINTGDAVYYDHGPVHALTPALARYKWARMFGQGTLRAFHCQVGSYFMKDDHDTLTDDSRPGDRTGDFTFEQGQQIFIEQTALPDPPFRTARWGRHLQVWIMEGRDFRRPRDSESTEPPTIWGQAQIDWLEQTLAASDASFLILVTAQPIVGPDRVSKNDNYANAGFASEGGRVRRLLARYPNLVVVSGDRHWQYVSVDPSTGVEEWSVGSASDAHAGGWPDNQWMPEHEFLRTGGGGFLSGSVNVLPDGPSMTLNLHDTAGTIVFSRERSARRNQNQ